MLFDRPESFVYRINKVGRVYRVRFLLFLRVLRKVWCVFLAFYRTDRGRVIGASDVLMRLPGPNVQGVRPPTSAFELSCQCVLR